MNTREIKVEKQGWIPKKERKWLIVAIIIAALIIRGVRAGGDTGTGRTGTWNVEGGGAGRTTHK